MHERFGRPHGPWGYFGCRVCDKEWLESYPEDRDSYDEKRGRWV